MGTSCNALLVFQAGPGGKVLIDQNEEVVYYTNHLNQTYWDFIVAHQFHDLDKLRQDRDTDFAVNSMELKASWRVARRQHPDGSWGDWLIEDAEERFYVIETMIPAIGVNEQGQVHAKPDEQSAAKMALVGMHVVGVVAHHPEFIWATFEHVDNAPDYADTPTASGGPKGPWSFYAPNTPRDETNQFNINDPLAIVNVCPETQLHGLGFIRVPVDPEDLSQKVPAEGDDRRMPLSLGDAGRGLLSLTYTQYFYLQQWDANRANDHRLVLNAGEKLDKAALVAGLGGRFSPGIDMTYISREQDLYERDWQTSGMGPFRVHRKPVSYQNAGPAWPGQLV